jgi:hypothetical protein
MKKLVFLGMAMLVGFAIGCGGVDETPTSADTGAMDQAQQESDLKKAVESGALDPATYGQE